MKTEDTHILLTRTSTI